MTQRTGLSAGTWIALMTSFVIILGFMGGGVVKAYEVFAPKNKVEAIEKDIKNISHNLKRLIWEKGMKWEIVAK